MKKGFQNKTAEELALLLQERRAAIRELRFAKAGGKLKNPHKLPEARRDIARILTFLKRAEQK